jgi:uncharacterized membrane protein YqiK
LASVEKEKALELERRNIQEVIRERVMVERAVVEEQQKIKDTEAFASAERTKKVEVVAAEAAAEQSLVKEIKAAEAARKAAESLAAKVRLEADAHRDRAEKESQALKLLADAKSADHAAEGLAEAKVLQAKATAIQEQGLAEARVLKEKYTAEAQGINDKAAAMKEFDSVGKEHEEFKLRLEKDKQIEIAAISAQKSIAESQALVIGEALKSAKIDIVGGDGQFFNQISSAIRGGKAIDRFVLSSQVATDVKDTFFTGNPEQFKERLGALLEQFHVNASDLKDLSVAALVGRILASNNANGSIPQLVQMLGIANHLNLADTPIAQLLTNK